MKSKFFSLMIFMVAAVPALSACGSTSPLLKPAPTLPAVIDSSNIIAEGHLEPVRFAKIALNASGLVSEVLVQEGSEMAAGDLIARLESSEARTLDVARSSALQELTSAYQAVRDAQYELDNFDIPSDFLSQMPTEGVAMTLERLHVAREAFEPYKNLSDRRLNLKGVEQESEIYRDIPRLYKKRLDDAWADYRKAIRWLELESNLKAAQARLMQAQGDYNGLQDASFAEDTAGVRAALASAELRAPFAGTITDLDLKVGEFVAPGQPVVTIADLSTWVVKTTDLTEIDVVELEEGQPVTVTLDAIPGVELNGTVLSVGQSYSENQGDVVYEVAVLLTNGNPAMRWGMTAAVEFE